MRRPIHLFVIFCLMMAGIVSVTDGQPMQLQPTPSFHWRCIAGDTLLNHNPAIRAVEGMLTFDSLPYAQDYTMVIVCRPVADTETMLWRLSYGDSNERAITTECIVSDSLLIRYAEQTDGQPIINTLRQTAPDSTSPHVRLSLGGVGMPDVSEVIYYPLRLGNAALRRLQSCLAIRYGITLGPVDYLDGLGHHVWEYADSGLYHHRVIGVGIDTLTGLCQRCSRSEMDGAVLTVSADSLRQGAFLLIGDDDAPMFFATKGPFDVLERSWKTQSTNAMGCSYTLTIDIRGWTMPGDSLLLLVDDTVYLPAYSNSDSVVFQGVVFPSDSSLFTIGRGALPESADGKGSASDRNKDDGRQFYTHIYPNPTKGQYTIEVSGAEWVRISVVNTLGQEVSTFHDSGHTRYNFKGTLPPDNVYYATIVTERGSQTTKIVAKQ